MGHPKPGTGKVFCQWFVGDDLHEGNFPAEVLVPLTRQDGEWWDESTE